MTGEQIRAIRTAYGWTQKQLGERLGVSGQYIEARENDRTKTIKPEIMQKLSELYWNAPAKPDCITVAKTAVRATWQRIINASASDWRIDRA